MIYISPLTDSITHQSSSLTSNWSGPVSKAKVCLVTVLLAELTLSNVIKHIMGYNGGSSI